jgi:hypothetical protein
LLAAPGGSFFELGTCDMSMTITIKLSDITIAGAGNADDHTCL